MPRRLWGVVARGATSDTAGLLILATASLIRAVSYMPGNVNIDRQPAHWLEGLLPIPAWAVVWMLAGILCLLAIAAPRIMPTAVGIAAGLHAMWALSFVGIWLVGESSRGYVSAVGYAAIALLALWGFGRVKELPTPPLAPARG